MPGTRRVAAPLVLAAGLTLSACSGIDTVVPDADAYVRIGDNFFQPESVTVARGQVVRWTNEGIRQHRVASTAGLWQSEQLPPMWWFEVRFDSSGTFDFICQIDSTHVETVTVVVP